MLFWTIFCDYHVNPYFYRSSCKYGCQIYDDTKKCDCHYSEDSNYLYSEFNQTECELGCMYQMNRDFFPFYKAFDKSSGFSGSMIESYSDLNETVTECDLEDTCKAVSFNSESSPTTHGTVERIFEEDSYFLVKREFLDGVDLEYMTTTQTSTLTSTQTSTPTSTLTSTETTSATSSQTTTTELVETVNISDTEIAILVVVLVILSIVLPLGVIHYRRKRLYSSRVTPDISRETFSNPLYGVPEPDNIDENHNYMDVFEEEQG